MRRKNTEYNQFDKYNDKMRGELRKMCEIIVNHQVRWQKYGNEKEK